MPTPDVEATEKKKGGNWIALAVVAAVTIVAVVLGQQYVKGDAKAADVAAAGGSSTVSVDGVKPAPKVGDAAPTFEATDLDGAKVALEAKRGKPVWMVFMATWCTECRIEAPDVQAAHESRDDIDVIAVYLNEDERTAGEYAERVGLTFNQIADDSGSIAAAYGVRAIPAHFFIDADGTVQDVLVGALSANRIEEAINTVVESSDS